MSDVCIHDPEGSPLDARVEHAGSNLIVHSRSGAGSTARNPDYRSALTNILRRLNSAGRKPDVFLDSLRVQHLPLEERLIASASELPDGEVEQFNHLIRAMNKNRRSNGAWSRILLRIPGDARDIGTLVARDADSHKMDRVSARLTTEEQRRVSVEAVHAAVASILSGGAPTNFAGSRDYDLITPAGDRLAPKQVFGRALELAGVIAEARPHHFSAGWSQPSFELLQAAGYDIVSKTEASAEANRRRRRHARSIVELEMDVASVGIDAEERSWIEGDTRMATHLRTERKRSVKAAAAKRAAVRANNDGQLACDHCSTNWYEVYGTLIADGIFDVHHTIPLKDMDEGHETTMGDLLCLCANCHRAEHRRMAMGKD